jgi:hypothetical protein
MKVVLGESIDIPVSIAMDRSSWRRLVDAMQNTGRKPLADREAIAELGTAIRGALAQAGLEWVTVPPLPEPPQEPVPPGAPQTDEERGHE